MANHRRRWALASWFFGVLLLAFLIGVRNFAPSLLLFSKHLVLGFVAAVLASLFAFTTVVASRRKLVRGDGEWPQLAAAVLAFLCVFLSWGSVFSPVDEIGDNVPIRQSLSGIVRDNRGQPLADVDISLRQIPARARSGAAGDFRFDVTAPLEAGVILFAQKPGYRAHEQFAKLGSLKLAVTLQALR
jgi:hypothetical protein